MNRLLRLSIVTALFLGLNSPGHAKKAVVDSEKIWVGIEPRQCLSNAWEKDWLKSHHKKGYQYPIRQETEVLLAFFKKKQIPVFELRRKPYMGEKPLRETCGCNRGDFIFLLINRVSMEAASHYGFKYASDADIPKKSSK